jgi:hypothetical protein
MYRKEIIVGCYTPGDYAAEAHERLIPSVEALGLPHDIREMSNTGSWITNNAACQKFLLQMHDSFPDVDFLYIDVDGVVRSDPWPMLRELQCDVGAYYLDGTELLSGTLYLPATKMRRYLLTKWITLNEIQPNIWDQKHLQHIVSTDSSIRCARLPAEYCCIFDLQRKRTPHIVPVVEHFQASRRYKRSVKPL